MSKGTKRKMLRKRPKEDDVDRIPQINLVGYFAEPLGSPVEMYREMLRIALSRFGDHEVNFAIHAAHIPKTAPVKVFHSSPSLLDLEKSIQSEISVYLGRCGRNLGLLDITVDGRWSAHFVNQISRYFANAEQPHFHFSCYMDGDTMGYLVEDTRLLSFTRDIIAALDRTGKCYYAFVDADESARVDNGHYFGSGFEGYAPWRYQVNKVDWLRDFQERRERVRFPSWGIYLGPQLAAKANTIGDLYGQYAARKKEDPDQYAERFDSGGLFLTVGEHPIDTVYLLPDRSDSAPVQNAAWLWSWFRRAGMI